ncbi:hypothetical protein V3C99_018544 [Haemonchus contortus]|uniref:Uncharacterized protein n=1 Tax=Haemonchus contortus TaxID=6289 RepID=A0A7I4Z050_HAECO|nr:unnamed protein product [Haemonchus contortus]
MAENSAGPAGKSPTLQLKTQAPQTNGRRFQMYWEKYNAPCVSNHTEARQRAMIKWTRTLTQVNGKDNLVTGEANSFTAYRPPWAPPYEVYSAGDYAPGTPSNCLAGSGHTP